MVFCIVMHTFKARTTGSLAILFLYSVLFTNLGLYGVELAGFSLVLLFLHIIFNKRAEVELDTRLISLFLFQFFVTLYLVFVNLLTEPEHQTEIIRSIRVFLYIYVTVWVVIKNNRLADRVLVTFILFHALIIILGALNHDFFELTLNFINYEKPWWFGRGLGLNTSYDTAGFVLLVGIFILADNNWNMRSFTLAFFLLVSGFFTGRTFMVLGPIVFTILYIVVPLKSISSKLNIFSIISSFIVFIILVILTYILYFDDFIFYGIDDFIQNREGYYGSYIILLRHWDSFYSLLSVFGSGGELICVDIGYLKALHFGGVIYLILQCSSVFLVYLLFYSSKYKVEQFIFMIIFLIYNFKIYAIYSSVLYVAFLFVMFRYRYCEQ